MQEPRPSELYWHGGTFWAVLRCGSNQKGTRDAMAAIDEFRSACHQQYFAFNSHINGRSWAYENWTQQLDPTNVDGQISVGTAFPNAPQLPGRSTIAWIGEKQLLAGLKEGGEFENQHAKALVVFLFHLWEEMYRKKIAGVLSVEKDQVKCTLMGELRRVRNIIVHDNAVLPEDFVRRYKLKMLPQIWNLPPGELRITQKMVHAMMEQINGLLVEVASAGLPTVATKFAPIYMVFPPPKE